MGLAVWSPHSLELFQIQQIISLLAFTYHHHYITNVRGISGFISLFGLGDWWMTFSFVVKTIFIGARYPTCYSWSRGALMSVKMIFQRARFPHSTPFWFSPRWKFITLMHVDISYVSFHVILWLVRAIRTRVPSIKSSMRPKQLQRPWSIVRLNKLLLLLLLLLFLQRKAPREQNSHALPRCALACLGPSQW